MVLEESAVLQASTLAAGLEDRAAFSAASPSVPRVPNLDMPLEQVEKTLLERALNDTSGNQTQAAQKLGISRDTLRYRMKKFRIGR